MIELSNNLFSNDVKFKDLVVIYSNTKLMHILIEYCNAFCFYYTISRDIILLQVSMSQTSSQELQLGVGEMH